MTRDDRTRILLVDDNPAFLDAAGQFIASQGDLTLAGKATNGEEALAAVASEPIDCVLMDAAMPVMDGFEATRRIKGQPGAPLVVMLSVHDGAAIALEAWAAGADGFLSKTDFAGQLVPLLRTLRSGSPPARVTEPRSSAPRRTAGVEEDGTGH